MRGRQPSGPEYVRQLEGSALAKARAEVVLQTLAGQRRVQEACGRLGIGAARFQQLRRELVQAALASQEPRPPGRPPALSASASALAQAQAALQARVAELELELQVARAREEIVLTLARAAPGGAAKKLGRQSRLE